MKSVWDAINWSMMYAHYAPIEYELKRRIEGYIFDSFQPADNFGICGLVRDEIYESVL